MTLSDSIDYLAKNRKLVILFLFIFYPFGVYLMWKGKHFNPDLRWMITFFWLLIYLIMPAQETPQDSTSECSATFYQNGCTYYRDSDCQVIAQSCD